MKMHAKNRNVAIIGIGQTSFSSHKEDQNQVEMVQEAVINALADAGLKIGDIDCIVHGNMELFEMQFAPDLWHSLGTGAYDRRDHRRHTGLRRG
jgi:acetyl-CoA C-acetyltransferase